MASWTMARRLAEACASSVAGRVAAAPSSSGKRVTATAYVRFPACRTFHDLSHTLNQSSLNPFSSSSASPLSTSCASLSEPAVGFRRPEEIPWQRDLVNSIHLIGHINRSVDIRYLDSGKICSHTSIRVKRSILSDGIENSVFDLQFWGKLAEIAAAHLKEDDHVYVAGSVWVEDFVDKDNVQKSFCMVVARDLKFVVKGDQVTNDGNSRVDEQCEQFSSIDDQWKDFFQNPGEYWDNRVGKKNPRSPDFKHKSTGVALWIESRRTPSWVFDRLEQGGPKLEETSEVISKGDRLKEMEKLWQAFFANPSDWWDNRDSKKNVKQPDFKNKTTGEALWIEGYNNPIWVKSQLQAMDSKVKFATHGGGKASGLKDRSSKTSFDDEDLGFF